MARDQDSADGSLTHTGVVRERIEAPVASVWDIIADFGAIERFVPHAKVERVEGEGVGCVRIIPTPNGTGREQLIELDEDRFRLGYRLLEPSPLEVSDYTATMELEADGDRACWISWSGTYATDSAADVDAASEWLRGFYSNAIAGIRKLVT